MSLHRFKNVIWGMRVSYTNSKLITTKKLLQCVNHCLQKGYNDLECLCLSDDSLGLGGLLCLILCVVCRVAQGRNTCMCEFRLNRACLSISLKKDSEECLLLFVRIATGSWNYSMEEMTTEKHTQITCTVKHSYSKTLSTNNFDLL